MATIVVMTRQSCNLIFSDWVFNFC